MNDFDQIKREIFWILANKGKSKNIDIINSPILRDARIGNSISHVKRSNYLEAFDKIVNNNQYFVMFNDSSILHLDYLFDESKKVIFSRLTYLPYIENEIEENVQYSKYIRIDYEPDDHVEIIHTKCHMHIGIDKNNFRIPVATLFFPLEFIYFILKYIYHEDSEFLRLIKLENTKSTKLLDNELNKLRLCIG